MWLLNLTVQESNKSVLYQVIIVLQVHLKIAVIFDHSRLGMEDIFFPNKITQSPTYITFIL